MEYRSIKEIIDAFYPDMEYRNASGGNLRLSRCPFCGGKKAYINPKPSVNGFFCHSGKCCKQFGFMSLYRELSGQMDAKYSDVVAFIDGHHSYGKSYKQMLPRVQEVAPAPLDQRHKVYHKLLTLLTLNTDDMENLMKRGLTKEQIMKLGYKSCPSREQIPEIIKALEKDGLNLKGIPGFYKRYGKYTMMLANGFFIPYRSLSGKIQGLQIRLKGDENVIIDQDISFTDTIDYTIKVRNKNPYPVTLRVLDSIPEGAVVDTEKTTSGYSVDNLGTIHWEHHFGADEERTFTYALRTSILPNVAVKAVLRPRYIWFTSGNKDGGTPVTNYTHFVGKLQEVMYLTEGALKADVTYCLSNKSKCFVAITGITSVKDIPQIFRHFKTCGVREIRIVFDMDRTYNQKVMEAIETVKEMAISARLKYSVPEWDISMGKGIDDFTLTYLKEHKKRS